MIPKVLYEFLILMETSYKYDEKSHTHIGAERVKLFEKRDKCQLLATRLKEVIDPVNIDMSVDDICTYAKVWINNGRIPNEEFKDFMDSAENLSSGKKGEDEKISYSKIRQEPLFAEIMGENAKDQMPQLEKLLNEPINIEQSTKIMEIYKRLEELDEKLDAKVKKGIIKNNQYEYWSMQLEYLGVYYSNILRNQQKSSVFPSKILEASNNEYCEPMIENLPFIEEFRRHKEKENGDSHKTITEIENDPLDEMLNEYQEKYRYDEMSDEEKIGFEDAFEQMHKNQERQLAPVEKTEPVEGRRRL